MKKIAFLFSLLIALTTCAQTWIKHGAEWHYNYSGIGNGGFIKINYTNDTLIKGKTCQKLVPVDYQFGLNQFNKAYFIGKVTMPAEFTYSSGDTVFYFKNMQFHVLYNFGAKAGDTWNLGVDTNQFKCGSSYARVDSVGIIVINGKTYRWIAMSPLNKSSVGFSGKAIERFGASESYLFPLENACDNSIDDFPSYSFGCYSDSLFPVYNVTSNDCEYLLSVNENSDKKFDLSVFPNPTAGIVGVQGAGVKSIEVFNCIGEKIQQNTQTKSIDLSAYPDGIYFLKIITNSGIVNQKVAKSGLR